MQFDLIECTKLIFKILIVIYLTSEFDTQPKKTELFRFHEINTQVIIKPKY